MDIIIMDKGTMRAKHFIRVLFDRMDDHTPAFFAKFNPVEIGGTVYIEKSLQINTTAPRFVAAMRAIFEADAAHEIALAQMSHEEKFYDGKPWSLREINMVESIKSTIEFGQPQQLNTLVTWLRNFDWQTGRANS